MHYRMFGPRSLFKNPLRILKDEGITTIGLMPTGGLTNVDNNNRNRGGLTLA